MRMFLKVAALCGLVISIGCEDQSDDMIPNVVPGQYEPVEGEAEIIDSDPMGSIKSEGETITFVDPNTENRNDGEANSVEEVPVKD